MRLPFTPTAKDLEKSAAVDAAMARQAAERKTAATKAAADAQVAARLTQEHDAPIVWIHEDYR